MSLQQEDKAELGDHEARIKVFHEARSPNLITGRGPDRRRVRLLARDRRVHPLRGPGRRATTGGIGKSFKVSNSWEYTGDGHALAMRGRRPDQHGVHPVPPDRHGPAAVGEGHPGHRGRVGDGGVLTNSEGKRFMFDYIPAVFKGQYAETEAESRPVAQGQRPRAAPLICCPATRWPARSTRGEGRPRQPTRRGLPDIATRMTPEEIKRRPPSMYHQFMELAEVDITKDEMEVGPTCHYVMGGIEVDPTPARPRPSGLFAAGECSGGMHGLQPPRRQLAVGPAGVRPSRRPRSRRLRALPA